MITSNHQLTLEQYLEVKALAEQCRQQDGNHFPLFGHVLLQPRSLPCNWFYYHDTQLIGFVSAFFFYENACELAILVHPDWRRRHIAKELLSHIVPVMQSRNPEYVLFPSPRGLNNTWLMARGFRFNNSEVQMQWRDKARPVIARTDILMQAAVAETDATALAEIDVLCFLANHESMQARYFNLLLDPAYVVIMLRYQGQPIGKAHLHFELDQVQLSDVAVLPQFQGQGFGQALVAYCMAYVADHSELPIRLDVDMNNYNAKHIYQKLGFYTTNAWDYWTIGVSELQHYALQNGSQLA
jgi:ribosomal protein S18 acetylase RimI-like enzyme